MLAKITITSVAALVCACAAQAAPARLHGMNWDQEVAAGPTYVPAQYDGMQRVGVRTVRTVFRWAAMEPVAGGGVSFELTDVIVRNAVKNRLSVLPVLMSTPGWAQKYPGRTASPPKRRKDFTRFLKRLVARYGHGGSFWRQNPRLPKRPLTHWQIWNEPEIPSAWNEPKFWIGYTKLVRASDRALERADPRAKLVLAGMTGYSWVGLKRLYEQGVRGHFDVAAIHPYTGSPERVAEIVRRNRRVLRRWREPRKPLWITELSWPASEGRMRPPDGLRSVVTTDRGMARRLRSAYRYFADPKDPRHRVGRVYWYTWASDYAGENNVFRFSGLLRVTDGKFERMPAWYAFRRVARR